MGQSTDGILFYGYSWDEPQPDPDDYDPDDYDEDEEPEGARGFKADLGDWADGVLRAQGHRNPIDDCPEGGYREFAAANRAALDAWRALKNELKDSVGVGWGHHCSGDYSIPYLHIKGTETTAYRGTPKPITSLEVGADWKAQLDDFLASQNITPPAGDNQPGWWLASYWG